MWRWRVCYPKIREFSFLFLPRHSLRPLPRLPCVILKDETVLSVYGVPQTGRPIPLFACLPCCCCLLLLCCDEHMRLARNGPSSVFRGGIQRHTKGQR
jgi:hypothetical protein